jgi:choline kinase
VTAVILTAGRGGRLRAVVGDQPKCLARVGGCTILERQMRALRASGISRIIVVTGYAAPVVRRACGPGVHFVHNPIYASTNSLYSLWLARDRLTQGFVVLNCDVVFHRQILADLLSARYEDALAMSAVSDDERYGDEEMKLRVRRGRVVDIAKTIRPGDADGENIGIAKFGPTGAAHLVDELDRMVAGGRVTEWLPAAFRRFCRQRPLRAVDHRGFAWIEVDSPADYRRACTQIAPALDDAPAGGASADLAARRAAGHV